MSVALDPSRIDELARQFMKGFGIPGLALALVYPRGPAYVQAYGVRTLAHAEPVSPRTQFAIGSTSKAFLSASLALLVDEGRLGWDDPVVRHLADFRMSDPVVTRMMTVRDLLVHRSGLPLGAGDLMLFPSTDHRREEILQALPHLSLATGFRSGYGYDNILYIVAALVLERITRESWDSFVSERIFKPLAMTEAVTNRALVATSDLAGRHVRLGPPVRGMGDLTLIAPQETALLGPAGGIHLSASEIVAWLTVQLGSGVLPDGSRLWSVEQAREMWTPQTITMSGPGPDPDSPDRPVMQGYALGWGVNDYRGQRMVTHGGGVAGQSSRVALLPEVGAGLAIVCNTADGDALSGLRYALFDHLLGVEEFDWLGTIRARISQVHARALEVVAKGDVVPPPGGPSLVLECYTGRYRDAWYGDVVVKLIGGELAIDFTRTPAFKSGLEAFGPDAFRTRFRPEAGEDAIITFRIQDGKATGITMKALSPLADFSFDFHDLAFVRVT